MFAATNALVRVCSRRSAPRATRRSRVRSRVRSATRAGSRCRASRRPAACDAVTRSPSWRATGPFCARCRRRAPRFAIARSAGRLRRLAAPHHSRVQVRGAPAARRAARAGSCGTRAATCSPAPTPSSPCRSIPFVRGSAASIRPTIWLATLALPSGGRCAAAATARRRRALPAARRHANVRAAPSRRRAGAVRRICRALPALRSSSSIDDVMTTGATLEACSRVLAGERASGACAR